MKYLTPILYDFRKSFLRPISLLLLMLFILIGVGITYLVILGLSQLYPSTNILAIAVNDGDVCRLYGYVYDLAGNPAEGGLVIQRSNGNAMYSRVLGSYFNVSDAGLCILFGEGINIKLRSSYGEYNVRKDVLYRPSYVGINTTTVLLYTGYIQPAYTGSIYTGYHTDTQHAHTIAISIPMVCRLIILSRTRGEARLIFGAINITQIGTNVSFLPLKNVVLDYGFTKSQESSKNITFERLGIVSDSIVKVFDLKINTSADILVIRVSLPNNNSQFLNINMMQPDIETLYVNTLTSNVGYMAFVWFFPIVLIYIVNIMLAKPRSIGSLEFILARPITRLDLYVTRYLAGVATIATSSALLLLGLTISNKILMGITLDAYSVTLLYLGLVAGLTSFYSLCYMIASSTRSGAYLAISIALYLLFVMLWNIVVIAVSYALGVGLANTSEVERNISYLNPLSPASLFAPYYVRKHYGISTGDAINPILAILSPVAWIAITFIIGYIRFRKINLSS